MPLASCRLPLVTCHLSPATRHSPPLLPIFLPTAAVECLVAILAEQSSNHLPHRLTVVCPVKNQSIGRIQGIWAGSSASLRNQELRGHVCTRRLYVSYLFMDHRATTRRSLSHVPLAHSAPMHSTISHIVLHLIFSFLFPSSLSFKCFPAITNRRFLTLITNSTYNNVRHRTSQSGAYCS